MIAKLPKKKKTTKKRNLAYKRKNLIKKELSHKVLSFVGVAFCDFMRFVFPSIFDSKRLL